MRKVALALFVVLMSIIGIIALCGLIMSDVWCLW